ncbi:hypothetical protein E2C01_087220 [Portunus trituberculatus]|uniref:Uncharacterized protein n=1 Tax=Portunus trituberculatus TaxID=210409 RepID=A0A5B7JGQ9_PORTR|nr:hypothetical protein [Portunus trituberculatus]
MDSLKNFALRLYATFKFSLKTFILDMRMP